MNPENKEQLAHILALSAQAGVVIKHASEETGLSLIELAMVFRLAAETCDQYHYLNERVKMTEKLRGYRP